MMIQSQLNTRKVKKSLVKAFQKQELNKNNNIRNIWTLKYLFHVLFENGKVHFLSRDISEIKRLVCIQKKTSN